MSGKTVLKLMREEGLFTSIRAKRYVSYRGEVGKVAPNIVDRDFKAIRPTEKLTTDITEFMVSGERVHLSPLLDLFNNEVVSWSVSRTQNLKTVREMPEGADGILRGRSALIHSDQGWQYQHRSYQCILEDLGVTQSMSRKGNCLDNAPMESFFGHLKQEFYHKRRFESYEEFVAAIDAYIDYWNTRRYQVRLKGMSPVEYRAHSESAA